MIGLTPKSDDRLADNEELDYHHFQYKEDEKPDIDLHPILELLGMLDDDPS